MKSRPQGVQTANTPAEQISSFQDEASTQEGYKCAVVFRTGAAVPRCRHGWQRQECGQSWALATCVLHVVPVAIVARLGTVHVLFEGATVDLCTNSCGSSISWLGRVDSSLGCSSRMDSRVRI